VTAGHSFRRRIGSGTQVSEDGRSSLSSIGLTYCITGHGWPF